MLRRLLGPLAVTALAVLPPVSVSASPLLVNGSFELGPPPFDNHDIDIPSGSTDITGWLVTGGGIDLLEDPWDVTDGLRGVDLDGRSPGGIAQTFATNAGELYAVSFDLSGNPEGPAILKMVRVTVGGFSQDYTFDSSGQTIDALLWQTIVFLFVASEANSTLSFASLSVPGNAYGALIDNVNVVAAVPEPSTLALLGSAIGLVSLRRRVHR